jgi:2-C-methyl-D-erythritol 4-phosphate cytidylyltransferase
MIKAILLMGGDGKRFGSDTPKQFHRLSGKPVYLHTLEKFLACQQFQEIILVSHPDWIETICEQTSAYPSVRIVPGGETRQESSYRGLLACGPDTELVVIHDAVRPFITPKILSDNIAVALHFGAADTCIPSADTLVHTSDGLNISSIPPRSEYRRGQTPQSFAYPLILEAHEQTQLTNCSDDCQLVLNLGKKVQIVEGDETNLKITTELDLFLAEQLLRLNTSRLPMVTRSLAGKRFAILGGTGGIGQAICTALRAEGAIPLIISKTSPDYPADLSCPKTTRSLFDELGPLDGLINSMGHFQVKNIHDLTPEEVNATISVNLTAAIYCSQYAHILSGGHLIHIASSSYSRGRKGYALYSATKAAIVNFTQGLAEELPHLKINAIIPQRTATPLRRNSFPDEDPSTLLSPEAVAEAIINLLKQDNLTGASIEVRKP